MQRYPSPTLAQAPDSSGPKWVPIPSKIDWPFVAGAVTVAALAAALAIFGAKK